MTTSGRIGGHGIDKKAYVCCFSGKTPRDAMVVAGLYSYNNTVSSDI